MVVLNAGIPMIFLEIPGMLIALVIVITVEYYILKRSGITFSPVLWANVVSTLVGVPLSNIARGYLAELTGNGPGISAFEASVYLGDYDYKGPAIIVVLIVLGFDYIFSVLIEYIFYWRRYRKLGPKLLFGRTVFANTISYLILLLALAIQSGVNAILF